MLKQLDNNNTNNIFGKKNGQTKWDVWFVLRLSSDCIEIWSYVSDEK